MKHEDVFKGNYNDIDLALQNTELFGYIKEFMLQQQLYRSAIREIVTRLEILDEEFKLHYDHNPIHNIEYRLKSPKSIINKLKRRGLAVSVNSIREKLTDVAGVRVICNYLDDVKWVAELLLRQDDITLINKRDYIQGPKNNGYRSLHLIVEIPIYLAERTERVKAEIQIRTIAMDFWASLEHQLKYKSQSDLTDDLRKRLSVCANYVSLLDVEMQLIYKEMQVAQKENDFSYEEDEYL